MSSNLSGDARLYVMDRDASGLRRVPTGLIGVVEPNWGPAPRDDTAATSTTTAGQAAPTGAATSAAELCARRPELRLPGRCGPPWQAFGK